MNDEAHARGRVARCCARCYVAGQIQVLPYYVNKQKRNKYRCEFKRGKGLRKKKTKEREEKTEETI